LCIESHKLISRNADQSRNDYFRIHLPQKKFYSHLRCMKSATSKLFIQAQALHQNGDRLRAQALYAQVIAQQPTHADAHLSLGNLWSELGQHANALASYEHVLRLLPGSAEAHFNRANSLKALHCYEEALASYNAALSLKPDYAQALNNRGNVLDKLRRPLEALTSYDTALALMPQSPLIHSNRAGTLKEMRRLDEALASFEQAFLLDPAQEFLLGNLLTIKMQLCDWSQLQEALDAYRLLIGAGRRVALPFHALALLDDPALHLQAAQIYAQAHHPAMPLALPLQKPERNAKIRLAYYSADFHNHATAYLMAELIERHDRSRFEVIGFSFGPDVQDEMRQRLVAGFDAFHDVRSLSDEQVAMQSHQMGIDIAVDLKGYTQDCRPSIFAYRCAPVQVSYLGYPGTLGVSYMDYIVADKIVLPPERYADYSEKVVALPHSYQVNDSQRNISDRVFTRQELGLPEDAFVFCCFNNNHKILPTTFESWMRVLLAVPCSVLWVFEENPIAGQHLRQAALHSGISPERLVFAPRMPLAEHLARHRSADLFIDTLPYNAHTTASDALWAGLPVLTCMGQSFAARVAASLLRALDLPELITHSPAEFEARAIALAQNVTELAAIAAKLQQNRMNSPLFDAKRFARHLEQAFETMHTRYMDALPPASFQVTETAI
jgi:protein O-GlcNAc transferase